MEKHNKLHPETILTHKKDWVILPNNIQQHQQEIRHQALHMGFSENIMPPNPLVNDWLTISFPTHGA